MQPAKPVVNRQYLRTLACSILTKYWLHSWVLVLRSNVSFFVLRTPAAEEDAYLHSDRDAIFPRRRITTPFSQGGRVETPSSASDSDNIRVHLKRVQLLEKINTNGQEELESNALGPALSRYILPPKKLRTWYTNDMQVAELKQADQ